MNAAANDGELDEASLVKLYMDLTGSSEASARSVYMFVNREDGEEKQNCNGLNAWKTEEAEVQPLVASSSAARAECEPDFGIGLFGREGLAISGE